MVDIVCLAESRGSLTANVIFLHGLGGHPRLTWQATNDEKTLWPRWLAKDIEGHAIWSVGYEAPISRWRGRAMHLVDRAENILGLLLARTEFRTGRIILIGHSFGGLVIKQLLRTLDRDAKKTAVAASLLDRIHKVAFLATPHSGADLAVWGDWLRIVFRPSAATMCLVRNDANLRDLNSWYRDNVERIHHLVLRETIPVRILGMIVKPDSGDPGLHRVRVWPTDTDHFSIAKPTGENHAVYTFVKNFVLETFEPPASKIDEIAETLDTVKDDTGQIRTDTGQILARMEEVNRPSQTTITFAQDAFRIEVPGSPSPLTEPELPWQSLADA